MATFLSDAKYNALLYLPVASAMLSIAGSSYIVYRVLNLSKRTTKHRLLLGLSLNDISSSAWVGFGGLVVAKFFNQPLCNLQGFFVVLGNATSFYSCCLSFYFMLTIRYGINETDMKQKYEPYFHLLSMSYPLITAILCIPMGLYNQNLTGCFITAHPLGCDQSDEYECTRGQHARTYAWLFHSGPVMIVFALIITTQVLIYRTIRNAVVASRRFDFRASITSGTDTDRQREQDLLRAAATQSLCYVVAYFMTFLLPTTVSFIELFGYAGFSEPRFFPFFCIILILYPIQGLLNFLVFIRPSYLRHRKNHPRVHSFWLAVRWMDDIKQTPSTRQKLRSINPSQEDATERNVDIHHPTLEDPTDRTHEDAADEMSPEKCRVTGTSA